MDAPARAFLEQVRQHIGHFICGLCTQKGVSLNRRLIFPVTVGKPRSVEDFWSWGQEAHHLGVSLFDLLLVDSSVKVSEPLQAHQAHSGPFVLSPSCMWYFKNILVQQIFRPMKNRVLDPDLCKTTFSDNAKSNRIGRICLGVPSLIHRNTVYTNQFAVNAILIRNRIPSSMASKGTSCLLDISRWSLTF